MQKAFCLCSCLFLLIAASAQITLIPQTICPGKNIVLELSGQPNGSTYQWQRSTASAGPYNDVPGANAQLLTTNIPGWYRVIVGPGNNIAGPVEVLTSLSPTPDFSFAPPGDCSNVPVLFINLSTPGTYQWDFGNPSSGTANTSAALNPSHVFITTPGTGTQTFDVKLIVTSFGGCIDSITKQVMVKQLPDAQLGGSGFISVGGQNFFRLCGLTSAQFQFTNQSTTTATNIFYEVIWGDGTPGYSGAAFPPSPFYHTYGLGNNTLQFIVTSQTGCRDTAEYYVFVGANPAVGLNNPGNTVICAGTNLIFPISGTASNTPGTTYTVTFNDGTPPVTYPHPPPANVSHNFSFSSCNTTSGIYPNSFSATIQATNPCGTSSATVSPIYVSKKAPTTFSIAPKDTVCVGTPVTIANTTLFNYDNSGGVCNFGKVVWIITPATGWVVTSGSLGDDDNGNSNGDLWTAGTNTVNLLFILPGNYSIKLKTSNAVCGNDSLTRMICVNPTPLANFDVSNNSGCAPLSVNTINNSNTPLCGSNTYQWSVVFVPAGGCVGITPPYIYANGTNATDAAPQFQFNSPGVYTLTLVTTSSAGVCISLPFTRTVMVKAKPIVTLAVLPAICKDGFILPSANAVCYAAAGATYEWTFPGGSPASSTSVNPGNIIYAAPGTYAVTLTVTNECGATTATGSVTVNDVPLANVPADIRVCPGALIGPLALGSSLSGSTITWANSNTSIGLGAGGTGTAIPAFTAVNTTAVVKIATLTITVSKNGCSSVKTFLITVDPKPVAPLIITPIAYCLDAVALPLAAVATPGHTLLWYTAATGGTGSVTAPVPATNATGTFTYYVSQVSSATTCEGPRAAITVNVKPVPLIAVVAIPPILCSSATGTITIIGLLPSLAFTVSYIKNGGAPTVASLLSNASGNILITGLTAGTYSDIFVTLNGCPSNTAGPFVLSDPSAPAAPAVGNNGPLCSGNNLQLTAAAVPGGSYSWTGPNGFTSNQQNPFITNAGVTASGNYNMSLTVAGCTSATAVTSVTINATPGAPAVSGNGPICAQADLQLTASSASGNLYAWTGPNGFSSTQQNPIISNATIAASGTYTVTVSAGTCSASSTIAIVVKPTPVITLGAITQPATCNGLNGSITITGLLNNTSYTISYTVNNNTTTQTLTSGASGTVVLPNLGAGVYSDIFVSLNGCVSNFLGPVTLNDPTPPAAPLANVNGPICSGNTLNLSAGTVAGNPVYSWSGPQSFSSQLQNPILLNASPAMSGIYTVTVSVNGCLSAPATVLADVRPTPVITSVTSNTPVCEGNDLNLNVTPATAGALSYAWTGPGGFSSSVQNPVIPNVTLGTAGIYSVTASLNICSATGTTTVVIKPKPSITALVLQPQNCNGSGQIVISGLSAGLTYTVSYIKNNGTATSFSAAAGTGGNIVIGNLSTGVYSDIFVILNGCPSNNEGPFTISDPTAPAAPTASSNAPVCSGNALQLNVTTAAAGIANYTWSGPNGFSSNLQSPVISVTTPAAAGNYSVTVTINNCTSVAATVQVVIHPLPPAPIVTSPVTYCIGAPAVPLAPSGLPNTYNWYTTPTGGNSLPDAPTPGTATPGTVDYYVSQTTPQNCEGPRAQVRVVVNPDATAEFTPAVVTGCPPFVLTPAIIGLQIFPGINSNYFWYANGVLLGSGVNFPGYTLNNSDQQITIRLIAVSAFGCRNDTAEHVFSTFKVPVPSYIKDVTEGCAPVTVTFTNTTPNQADFSYTWNFGNGQSSSSPQPPPVSFLAAPTYNDTTYIVRLNAFSACETRVFIDSVRVRSKPKAIFTPSNVNGCSPMRVTFTNSSLGVNNVYHWDFGDGQTLNTTSTAPFEHIFFTGVIQNFPVRLIAENGCGSDTVTYIIVAAPNNIALNFTFNGTAQYGCAPHTMSFFNNSSGGGTFVWNFGDGTTITTTNNIGTLPHTYNLPGVYNVSVTATNNCTDTTAFAVITVYAKPLAAFTADQYNVCVGHPVQFANGSAGQNSQQWQFGDGSFSAELNPLHAYPLPGLYTVKLIVFNANPSGNACSDSTTRQVNVTATLPGNITVSSVASPCAPHEVSFTNLDVPAVLTTWDFGDGSSGTGITVTHTYSQPGTYIASAVTTDPGGCKYLSQRTIVIGGPSGTLQLPGGFVCNGAPALFQASVANADSYLWDFGDGTTTVTATPSVFHQYINPGTYSPTLTLQSLQGCNVLLTASATIKADKVVAGFTASQTSVCGSSIINFTDTSHAFFGTAQVKWNFGDGQTGIGFNPTHSYAAGGTYNIQMIAIGNSGCSDTIYRNIFVTVTLPPTALINGPTEKCAGESVTFSSSVNAADPVNIRSWTLSNGATGSGNSFTYIFANAGSYTLQFIAGTTAGCYDTVYHAIIIKAVPQISAGADVTLCRGSSTALSVTGGNTYQWSPLQGLSCGTCTNPVANPLLTTDYVVTGWNSLGCSNTDTTLVNVIQPLNISASPNASMCTGETVQLQAGGAASYSWTPAASLNNASSPNPIASPGISTVYRLVGFDGFNCFTDTAFISVTVSPIPVVELGPDITLAAGTQHPLTTQIQNGPIAVWTWTPTADLSCTSCALPIANIKKDITYAVKVTTQAGCSATDNIHIKVFCSDAQLFIPNAFSPDGDGINDLLTVRGKGIGNIKYFRIFDRWGVLIFERSNFRPNDIQNSWNGMVKGKPATPDVFVYTAEVTCDNGSNFIYKGNITLIK